MRRRLHALYPVLADPRVVGLMLSWKTGGKLISLTAPHPPPRERFVWHGARGHFLGAIVLLALFVLLFGTGLFFLVIPVIPAVFISGAIAGSFLNFDSHAPKPKPGPELGTKTRPMFQLVRQAPFELPPFWRNSIAIASGVGSVLMMAPIAVVFAGLHGSLNSYRWEDVLGMAIVLAFVFGIAGIPVGIAVAIKTRQFRFLPLGVVSYALGGLVAGALLFPLTFLVSFILGYTISGSLFGLCLDLWKPRH